MTTMQENRRLNAVSLPEIIDALGGGVRDFASAPIYAALFGGVIALAGWLGIALLRVFNLPCIATTRDGDGPR